MENPETKISRISRNFQNRSGIFQKWPKIVQNWSFFGHFWVTKSGSKTEVVKNRVINTLINLLISFAPVSRHFYFLPFFALINLINENGPKMGHFWDPEGPKMVKKGSFLVIFGKSRFWSPFFMVLAKPCNFFGKSPIFEKSDQNRSELKKVEKSRKNTFFSCFFTKNTKKHEKNTKKSIFCIF